MSLDVTAIILALIALAGGFLTYLQSRAASKRTAALERRKLDIDADQQHWARADTIIQRLEAEVARLDETLRDARARLSAEALNNVELRERAQACELRIVRLKAVVQMLADEMRAAGLQVPGHID